MPPKIVYRLLCLVIPALLLLGTVDAQAQVVIKDRVDVEPVKKQTFSQAASYTTPSSGLVRIRYHYAERSIESSWVQVAPNDYSDDTIHTLDNRSFFLHTPTETVTDALGDKLGYDIFDQYHYNQYTGQGFTPNDFSSQYCVDDWSDNQALFRLYQARVSQYIPVADKEETTLLGFIDANTNLSFEFGIEGVLADPTNHYEYSNDGTNWSYFVEYKAPPHIPDGARGSPTLPESEYCPNGYLKGFSDPAQLTPHENIARHSNFFQLFIETIPLEFQIVPEDALVVLGSGTKLHTSTVLPSITEDLILTVSDPSKGYLALMDLDENNLEYVVEQGPSITILFDDLDENSTTDRFVLFIAGEEPQTGKQAGDGMEEDAEIQAVTTVQLSAYLSSAPDDLVGFGEVDVEEPTIEIVDRLDNVVTHLDIATWEFAYSSFPEFAVKNEQEDEASIDYENFIDGDFERFYIQIEDESKNDKTDEREIIKDAVTIETTKIDSNGDTVVDDNKTFIDLVETDVNTGVFRSEALILTAPDLTLPAVSSVGNPDLWLSDDDFEAHDNQTGVIEDDMPNDRTHRAEMGGTVRVEYTLSANNVRSAVAPVCEEIKTVKYQFVTFWEPFFDVGLDGVGPDFPGDPNHVPDADGSEGNGTFDCISAIGGDTGCRDVHVGGVVSEPYINMSRFYERVDFQNPDQKVPILEDPTAPFSIRYESDKYGQMAPQSKADLHIAQAKHAWMQGCIAFEEAGPMRIMDAPVGEDGLNIFEDQTYHDNIIVSLSENDMYQVFQKARDEFMYQDKDVVYIFLGAPFDSNRKSLFGLAFSKTWENGSELEGTDSAYLTLLSIYSEGSVGFAHIHLSPQATPTTLAHEFGHILGRWFGHDNNFLPYFIFPAQDFAIDEDNDGIPEVDYGPLVNYQVNMKRRLTEGVINEARLSPLANTGQ